MSYLAKFRASKANQLLQKLARVLQFISAIISLGLFSQRLKAILTRSHDYSRSDGAVEGILAAASLYSLLATLMQFALRHGAPKLLRWFLILMDVLFIGAFIAVAVLTRPNGGPSGDHKGQCARQRGINGLVPQNIRNQFHCRLPLGTFVLAIISTLLHAFTAIFHEIRDKIHEHRANDPENVHDEGPGAHGRKMTKAEKKQAKRDGVAH
ncbi:uncharacterized protein PG998_011436 [Apiospora kogelbergensis]|uniref:MARVEL domain-containing protein n=1 Tax=Apiospora kogelbergensis TaxID=1337665 RepID=A0AAW0RBW8_9PEZI